MLHSLCADESKVASVLRLKETPDVAFASPGGAFRIMSRGDSTPATRNGHKTAARVARPRRNRGVSLTDWVYETLHAQLLTCELEPGSEVSELELAGKFKVSKTPVREALARLASDGFVKAFPRRGYRIIPLTISDMNDAFDVRRVVEAGAIELACSHITEEELDKLQELADVKYNSGEGASRQALVTVNREFHAAIARGSHNERVYQLVIRHIDELERFFHLGARLRDVNSETMEDHRHIVEVLRKRDPVAARQVISAHVERTRQGLIATITSDRTASRLVV